MRTRLARLLRTAADRLDPTPAPPRRLLSEVQWDSVNSHDEIMRACGLAMEAPANRYCLGSTAWATDGVMRHANQPCDSRPRLLGPFRRRECPTCGEPLEQDAVDVTRGPGRPTQYAPGRLFCPACD